MMTPPTFEQALYNESLRQAYLDSLLPHCPESVLGLIYKTDKLELFSRLSPARQKEISEMLNQLGGKLSDYLPPLLMSVPKPISSQFGLFLRSPIFVEARSFHLLSEARFTNALFDHEIVHCSDFYQGITLSNGTVLNHKNIASLQDITLDAILEYRAYRVESERWKEKSMIDPEWTGYLDEELKIYRDILKCIDPQTDLERIAREEYLS